MIRRRGRRKKSEIVTFSINETLEKKVSFDGNSEQKAKKGLGGQSISFGALDIVVHAAKDETDVAFSKAPYKLNCEAKEEFSTVPQPPRASGSTVNVNNINNTSLPNLGGVKSRQLNIVSDKVEIRGEVPKCSDAACWWCCHKFEGRPAFLPTTYCEEHDSFKVYGNFCSWNCAKSYNYSTKGSKWAFRSMLLKFMVTKIQGECICIRPAPPRDQLEFFGGNMTIEQFRESNNKNFSTNVNGLVKLNSSFEEKNLHTSRRSRYIM